MADYRDIRSNALRDAATMMVVRLLGYPDLAVTAVRGLAEADYIVDAAAIASNLTGVEITWGDEYYDDGGNPADEAIWWIESMPEERTARAKELKEWRDREEE